MEKEIKVDIPKKEKKKSEPTRSELKEQLDSLQEKIAKAKEDYIKDLAELQTFRRRLTQESETKIKYASMKIIEELLTPIDMLAKIVSTPVESEEIKNYLIGFKMISDQLMQVLLDAGLKEIECREDMIFNSETMEAISTEVRSEINETTVLKVLRTGYYFHDRILRPASVHVAIKEEIKNENKGE